MKSSAERLWRVTPPYIGSEWIVRAASASQAKQMVQIAAMNRDPLNRKLWREMKSLRAKLIRFDELGIAIL